MHRRQRSQSQPQSKTEDRPSFIPVAAIASSVSARPPIKKTGLIAFPLDREEQRARAKWRRPVRDRFETVVGTI